ncbi:MAG: hypothetical protein WC779_02230 [Candidatus Omnitrophota bacterium]|jgi:hypothetical protein
MGLFSKKKKKLFGEILIDKGLATPGDIDDALKIQKQIWEEKQVQKAIGVILCEKGIIDIEDVNGVLKEQKQSEEFMLRTFIYSAFHSRQPR